MSTGRRVLLLALSLFVSSADVLAQGALAGDIYDEAPLRYSRREATDKVHGWQRTFEEGRPVLDESSEQAFLRGVLAELGVPAESQIMVFSHTSLQNSRISPTTPRALYFNENTYVGWVQGGEVEIITTDRQLGLVFYRLKSATLANAPHPVVERDNSCLICHAAGPDNPFPGLRAFSVFVNDEGKQVLRGRSLDVDYRTPLADRWGGWYVTGEIDGPQHRGNLLVNTTGGDEAVEAQARQARQQPRTLDGFFDTTRYLGDKSDVAALLVFEHQIAAHNRLIAAQGRARIAMFRDESYMAGGALTEETRKIFETEADGLLDVILFKDEASLAEHRVAADEAFAKAFAAAAHRDAKGRSLRDLRLDGRLFAYRCSYMIYSAAFERLPEDMRGIFWSRLERVLSEAEGSGRYPYLGNDERRAIREIIAQTHPLAPASWRGGALASR